MFNRIKDFFVGCARFRLENNDFRILNRLRNFKLTDVVIVDGSVEFTVPLKYVSDVEMITKSKGKKNANIFGVLNTFYMRRALSIAAIISVVTFIFLTSFVFRIRVIGVSPQRTQEIVQFIDIKPLSFKSIKKAQRVAAEITNRFDYVAHASSKIVGNVLYFKIYSVDMPGDTNVNNDIIATEDGVITNIIVASGRVMVKVGDAVRKGDILIKGEHRIGDDVYAPTRAVGEIMADVKYSEYGYNTTTEVLISKIIVRTGIKKFDRIETFIPVKDVLEVVATLNKSIV